MAAEAGESLARFVDFSWRNDLAGLEFAAGIPGSVGGGIFMNAGAFRREMKDVLLSISLMDPLGQVSERKIEETKFSYRSMGIEKGEVILGGKFILQRGKGDEIRARIEEIMRRAVWPNSLTTCPAPVRFLKIRRSRRPENSSRRRD